MREICTYGLEGGVAHPGHPYPYRPAVGFKLETTNSFLPPQPVLVGVDVVEGGEGESEAGGSFQQELQWGCVYKVYICLGSLMSGEVRFFRGTDGSLSSETLLSPTDGLETISITHVDAAGRQVASVAKGRSVRIQDPAGGITSNTTWSKERLPSKRGRKGWWQWTSQAGPCSRTSIRAAG